MTSYIPTPDRDADKPFLMPVEDVFTISGRGTVATGRVERGQLHTSATRSRSSVSRTRRRPPPSPAIEMFRKTLDFARGWRQHRCCCCVASTVTTIERGQVAVPSPAPFTPHTKFEGHVYVLNKEEGGRHTPFFNNYRPQFYFRTTDVTGVIDAAGGHRDGACPATTSTCTLS